MRAEPARRAPAGRAIGVPVTTKPVPCLATTTPSFRRTSIALMTVARETDHCSARSRPDGTVSPASNSPAAMRARSDSAISSYFSSAMAASLGVSLLDWSTGTQHTAVMSNPGLASSVLRFYGETVDESRRLHRSADGRLELARTKELLRRFLPQRRRACWTGEAGPACMPSGWSRTDTRSPWWTPSLATLSRQLPSVQRHLETREHWTRATIVTTWSSYWARSTICPMPTTVGGRLRRRVAWSSPVGW